MEPRFYGLSWHLVVRQRTLDCYVNVIALMYVQLLCDLTVTDLIMQ